VGLGHRTAGEHATVGLERDFEPSSSLRMGPTGGSRQAAREKKGRREGASGGPLGREKGERSRLGRAVERKKERLLRWALREEKERGEKERESGPGQK
jgi:hypothetical protein